MLSVLNMAQGAAVPARAAPAPAPAPAAPSFIQKMISEGISIPWFLILIFAGVIPFVPFSYLGYAGVNLMVTGSIWWGIAKTIVQVAVALIGKLSAQAFPDLWVMPYLFMYSPWYIFDIIQLFNPKFSRVDPKTGKIGGDGFKIPFLQKKIGRASGRLTLPVIVLIILIICAGLNNMLDYLPDEIISTVKPLIKTVLAVIGGGTAVAGGGVGAWTMGPTFLKGLSENMSGLTGGNASSVAAASTPSIPIPPPTIASGPAPSLTSGPKTGGGDATPLFGASTPPMEGGALDLDAIAQNLVEDTSAGVGAYLLVGSLAVVALGGATLAAVRR